MITKEFRAWAEGIKDLIEKRVGDLAYAWMSSTRPGVIDIGIEFLEGQGFWMSFDQEEFNRNNEKEKDKLAIMRYGDFVREIKNFVEKANKIVKALQ